jgi:hypothetical protein
MATCTSSSSATDSAASIVAGVVPQSSWSFEAPSRRRGPARPAAARSDAFPLPRKPKFIGSDSVASIIR